MQPGKRGLNKSRNVTRNLKNTAPILMTGLHMAHLLGYKSLITGHNLGVYERYSPYVIHKHFLRITAKLDKILRFVLKRQDKCGTFCLTTRSVKDDPETHPVWGSKTMFFFFWVSDVSSNQSHLSALLWVLKYIRVEPLDKKQIRDVGCFNRPTFCAQNGWYPLVNLQKAMENHNF